jgi:death-on-curing protein
VIVQPRFPSLDNVLALHRDTLAREGGAAGLRDPALLESAVMLPQQQFDGHWLHPDLAAMAAAYLFHIVRNHPFVDGNKRAGTMAAFVFLDLNGSDLIAPPDALEATVMAVADGSMDKARLMDWMRAQTRPRR